MATYLDLSQGSRLDLSSTVTSTSNIWRVDIAGFYDSVTNATVKFLLASSDGFLINISVGTGDDFSTNSFVVPRWSSASPGFLRDEGQKTLADGNSHIISVYTDGTDVFFEIDGVVVAPSKVNNINQPFSGFDRLILDPQPFRLEYIKFSESTSNVSPKHSWEASASNTSNTGAQPVLVDTVAAANATGVGFPTDGSAWSATTVPASLTVTQAALTPGATISGTYADYATIPTTLTVSDGTNTITVPATIDDTAKTFTGTMPALPTTGTANLVLFGNVTVELA